MKIYETLRGGLSSTEFSSNPLVTIIIPRNIFTSATKISIFPSEKKNFHDTFSKTCPVTRWLQSGFLLVRAFAPTCPTPPLQFAREPDVSSTTQTYPQVFSRNKGLSREYLHRYVYLKSETKGNFI